MLIETIQYYDENRRQPLYVLFLDARKAFDRVCYSELFNILLDKQVCKTKYMCFHTAQKKVIYPDLKINNIRIDRVSEFNFLGLIISSDLKWNKHIEHISLKISKVIGIMFRMKSILPSGILHTIYNTLIMPHNSYCLLNWGSKIHIGHRLLLLQKKALRMIDDSHYIAHTEPKCKKTTNCENI